MKKLTNKKFDIFGLSHSLKHLKEKYKTIHSLTIEEQSKYADEVCIENINDKSLIDFCKSINPYKENFSNYNTTSVGNLAYIILHCKNKEAVEICKELLQRHKDYRNRSWGVWN